MCEVCGYVPVSYTHLDVYKRQDEVRCAAPGADKMYHSYPSIMVPSSSCARLVRHRRPYSLENTIAPAAISPHLCAR